MEEASNPKKRKTKLAIWVVFGSFLAAWFY